ncbi:hypothetical protein N0V93_006597 [Gnomoniopsis smithogilvyi]|uniref:Uncharacterized protein n=1 Tax=Gnomoniopsis smithogilvyi TaxID=1191159 RepID=A0A9W9CVS9_9PEZI|nr:hypothetical protein N0V93_006597 [Gnomoniopsis smithogilvyi]
MTTRLQHYEPFSSPGPPGSSTTTPAPSIVSSSNLGKIYDEVLVITTVENAATCGWFSGFISQPYECSTSLSCATNLDNIIACSKKGDKSAFFSACIDLADATQEECSVSGVLCCNSINPSCMTLLWTANPMRSLVGCNAIASTWVMQDYPFEGGILTSSGAIDNPTSTLSSSERTPLSNTSQPPAAGSTHSSESSSQTHLRSPTLSSISSSGSDIVTPAPVPVSGPSFPTSSVTIPASNSNTLLPVKPIPSGGLSTGAEAGIGIGACAGLLALGLIALFLFKKSKTRATAQPEEPKNGTGGPLQDNPSGELPADVAPPARLARSLSTGWVGNGNEEYHMLEGASEVPVDMRGQGVGAVELPVSFVGMPPLGISQSQFSEYQTQASQYRRYSYITRNPQGSELYQGPPRKNSLRSESHI